MRGRDLFDEQVWRERPYQDDEYGALGAARGILAAALLGLAIWALVLFGAWAAFRALT